jgi:hypothetical protein
MSTLTTQITEDILLLPSLSASTTVHLSPLLSRFIVLEQLFPRGRMSEFVPEWGRFRMLQGLLEMDLWGILALWRAGRVSGAGWEAEDVIEIVDRRFGREAEGVVREIRGYPRR